MMREATPNRSAALPVRRFRRGTSVMELVVAVALLAAVTAMALPAARSVDGVRREGERRRRAVAELSNRLADLSRLSPAELLPRAEGGPVAANLTALREPFAASLPGATLSVTAAPVAGPGEIETVRLDGSLAWTTDAGAAARPVRLSAWAFGSPAELNTDGETEE